MPDLVVEIISTLHHQKEIKSKIYSKYGVKEYLDSKPDCK
jgi:Uma2 family endonuclease